MNKFLLDRLQEMSEAELYDALYKDHLTGVLNRRAFSAVGFKAVAVVDMDSLKYLNDTYGHRIGDRYLRRLAKELVRVFGDAHVFRIAGDEFAVIGPSRAYLIRGLVKVREERFEGMSFGVACNLTKADKLLGLEKRHREAAGVRAARGEVPPWIDDAEKFV